VTMISRKHTSAHSHSEAIYSDCDRYRYALTRTWDASGRRLLFIMLNPSKATEVMNDPTVERCERRARALGYGAMRVCNVFAWKETDPAKLKKAKAPVGPDNDRSLIEATAWADDVLCAWGVHGAHQDRHLEVEHLLSTNAQELNCLGTTKDGHPRHPLYVAYAQPLLPWTPTYAAAV